MPTYDPKDVIVSFGGVTLEGFGEDSIIKVTRNEDLFSIKVGADGQGARTRNANKSGRAELTLLNSSDSHKYLSDQIAIDELAGEGVGVFAVDDINSGKSSCHAAAAWIVRHPDWERSKEMGETTWIFESLDMDINHEGLVNGP